MLKIVRLGVLFLILLMGLGCGSAADEVSVVTPTPRPSETPLPKPVCEHSPRRYSSTTGDNRTIVYFDVSSMLPEDELVIRYQDEVIYQCRYVVSDPLTGEGYGFSIPVEKGTVSLEFENRERELIEVVTFEAVAEKYVSATLMLRGVEQVEWSIWMQDEPFQYE